MRWPRWTACWFSLVAAFGLASPAAANGAVVLTPSARSGTCIGDTSFDRGLRPFPDRCLQMGFLGPPVFSPDGRMVYLVASSGASVVLARDRATGVLSRVDCETESGGTLCPPRRADIGISPDGRSLYASNSRYDDDGYVQNRTLKVFARADDGSLTLVQCLGQIAAEKPRPGCTPTLPEQHNGELPVPEPRVSPDGTAVYLIWGSLLLRFARDPDTGMLALTSCWRGGDDGCYDVPAEDDIEGLALVDQDVYLNDGSLVGLRHDPDTGALFSTTSTSDLNLGEIAASPDGGRIYAVRARSTDLLWFERDPATGQTARLNCRPSRTNLMGRSGGCGTRKSPGGYNADTSLAVSPDGRTVIAAISSRNGCQKCEPVFPGAGWWNEVVTYHVTGDDPVAAGCIGDTLGCAPPIGYPDWVGYASTGPGPYLVNDLSEIVMLVPAPTVRIRPLTLWGRSAASITCPATRSRPCRGRLTISLLADGFPSSSNPRPPFIVRPLERLRYEVAPGATRTRSLRLSRRARLKVLRLANANEGRRGFDRTTAVLLVRVYDGSGRATPTGATSCLQVAGLRCMLDGRN